MAKESATKELEATAIHPVSNGAKEEIEEGVPYKATVTIEGAAPILFHEWNNEAVEEKSKAAKGSKAKKSDNLESYVVRCDNGHLAVKGTSFCAAIAVAGRYRQDPRSPRKSAKDLLKAALVPMTLYADTGAKVWDFEHRARVVVQGNGITRVRPALREGWKVTFEVLVNLPEYVSPAFLHDLIILAGKLCGLGDFRPTYGRFRVTSFETTTVT